MQVLSITCDNASPNDTMIDELALILDDFPGAANRTRCFTHILNLVAKSVMKQFDLPKAKAGEALTAAAQALSTLAGDIETEEALMEVGMAQDGDDNDDVDGLANVRDGMSVEELEELDETLQPVRLVLVKVRLLVIFFVFFLFHLTHLLSYANSPTPSKILQPLFFPNGHRFYSNMQRSVKRPTRSLSPFA